MYLPSLPQIARDLQTSATGVQLSLTAVLIGLALGQVIAGPLSDLYGRRPPLLIGVGIYVIASLLCAVAPSLPLLMVARVAQGMGGAAGIVIARAVVRDLYHGVAAVRFYSRLMLVFGLAPVLAPVIGAQLLRVTTWRGIFAVLAVIGALILLASAVGIPETWPRERRHGGGLASSVRTMSFLLRDGGLMGYALASGLAFAAMFAYISGSPFVIQDIYGASPQLFSLAFAVNGAGQALMAQVNARAVGRFSPKALLTFGLTANCLAGLALLVVVLVGIPGLPAILIPLFVLVASGGFVLPNSTALALARHPEAAGNASALLGVLQLVVGAAVAPLVGIAGTATAVPMALVIAVLGLAALLALRLTRGAETVF